VARIKVMVKCNYGGYTLEAEAGLNRQEKWIGQCIVAKAPFKETIVLYAPLRTPAATLDALLAAGRRRIDEQRGAEMSAQRLLEAEGESP
jgi:hypothetical protein